MEIYMGLGLLSKNPGLSGYVDFAWLKFAERRDGIPIFGY